MNRAVAGGIVKTTGGRGDVDLTAPDLRVPDGDDIVVIPDEPKGTSRARIRAFLVGAIVIVLAAAAITIALINRDGTHSTRLSSIAKRDHSSTPPLRPKRVARKPAKIPAKPRVSAPTPSVVTTIPTNVGGHTPVGPPAVTPSLPTTPPTTPAYPPSVLTWQATPAAPTIKAGGHAVVSVTVSNPTDGTVTLGQPLSCPPVLTPEHGGAAIAPGGVRADGAGDVAASDVDAAVQDLRDDNRRRVGRAARDRALQGAVREPAPDLGDGHRELSGGASAGAATLTHEAAALASGVPAPDADLLPVHDRVLETDLTDGTDRADGLGLDALVLVVQGVEHVRIRALAAANLTPPGRRSHAHPPGVGRPGAGVPFNPQSAGQAGELRVTGDTAGQDPRQWPWWRVGRMAASGPER